jgi:signal transduction histidine kinase/ligand-binding sensor domain-containing protein
MTRLAARVSILVLLLAAGSTAARAQEYRIQSWTSSDGLPQQSVNAVVQTRDGFLWISTFGGLARYDGARFEVFTRGNTAGITASRFLELFEARDGALWATSEGQGLVRYKDGGFRTYTTADGVPDANARKLFYDEDGRFLIDSPRGSAEWRDGRFVPYANRQPSLARPDLVNVFQQPSGAVWYLDQAGAHKFSQGRVVRDVTLGVDMKWVFEDREGRLWIEWDEHGKRHLAVEQGGRVRRFTAADGIPPFRTMTMFQDRQGTVWLTLNNGGGLLRFKDGVFRRFTTADGLPSNNLMGMTQDREGTLWIATDGGLASLTERVVTAYSTADGLSSDNVYPIAQDRDGVIWIGGWFGLTRFAGGRFENVSERYQLHDANVLALMPARDGSLWVGGFGHGVWRLADGRVQRFGLPPPMGTVVRAIAEDRSGTIWIGGNDGLTRYRDGAFTRVTRADGFIGATVLSILEARDGTIWIGTDAGLSRYRDGRFVNFGAAQGMTGTLVRSLHQDAAGVLWAGTYDTGLFRIAGDRFTRFTTNEGLFDNGAFQILPDGRDNFWISSNAGIYRVSRRELDDVAAGRAARVLSVPYGTRDGMLNPECNGGGQPAGIRAADGRLWFPTQKGVAVIDADHMQANPLPPPVVITSATVERQPAAHTDRLDILPGQTVFEINYAGLTYIRSELTRFRYKLVGLDQDWIEAGNRRTAYFSHVPYGDYQFVVTAANRDGVWNTEGASIAVAVRPPFWRTFWFEGAAALAAAGILALAYRRRLGHLRAEQAMHDRFSRRLLETQEEDRRRIAGELHDSLAQSLIVIKNWTAIARAAGSVDEMRPRLDDIAETTGEALREVREIAHNLGPHQLERLGLEVTIAAMVERVSDATGLRVTAEIAGVDGVLPRDAEVALYRMIQESMNNIVKHAAARRVDMNIAVDDDAVTATIRDDGRGFDAAGTAAALSRAGGFGLVSLPERARMAGGACVIESSPGTGTRVEIRLPRRGRGHD